MTELGNGLFAAKHYEEAVSVEEANLSMLRRVSASRRDVLTMQSNLASTYKDLGRVDEALQMRREVYSGFVQLYGEEHGESLREAFNYANDFFDLKRFEEAKALLRKAVPVARRVRGESDAITLKMRAVYANALYEDPGATLNDLSEAATTLEDTERTSRRVLGGAHPLTASIMKHLLFARMALLARETPDA
tara:strand:- start:109 stop:684 length:576 start_codon:yes stop_codon:yes gene_type:complete